MNPDLATLPPYLGLPLDAIVLVGDAATNSRAIEALLRADAVGMDTESKPTFAKVEVSNGPHLVQLATDDTAFLFPVDRLDDIGGSGGLKAVLESDRILKVGFGLNNDVGRLKSKLGIGLRHVADLARLLRAEGERNTIGARTAVARVFGQRLQKSRKVSTSNWARLPLTEQQMRYAADDAHVALRIHRALNPR